MLANKLLSFQRRTFKFCKLSRRKIHGYYFTISPNTSEIGKGESVNIYQAPEYNELHEYLTKKGYYDLIPRSDKSYKLMIEAWQNCVFDTSFKAKYFGLLPFLFEDRQTTQAQKKFIVKMDLFPESKHYKFVCVMMSG